MENRALPRRVLIRFAVAAAALLAACGCHRGGEAGALRAGEPAPGALPRAETQLVWLIGVEDGLACAAPARELRALKSRLGARMQLTVVVVGDSDGLIEGVVRRERLDASLLQMDRDTFREQFRGTPVPALVLVRGGRVAQVWSYSASVRPAGEAPGETVGDVLDGLPGA